MNKISVWNKNIMVRSARAFQPEVGEQIKSYGSSVGMSDPWGASGSGYGLLSNAIRYTGPLIYFRG